MPKRLPARYSEIGCRIPKEYFWVIGWGESDVGTETGSYDAALHMGGIENYHVLLYTSVLPPEATELQRLPDIHPWVRARGNHRSSAAGTPWAFWGWKGGQTRENRALAVLSGSEMSQK